MRKAQTNLWTYICLTILLIFWTPASAQPEILYSRFGDISVLKDFENGSSIKLNGVTIHSTPKLEHLSVRQIIQTKTRDYIILAENLGGSGTPDSLSILAIGPNGFSKLFPNLDLMIAASGVSHVVTPDGIRFQLEDEGVFEKFALIADDKISISRKAIARPKSISHQECQHLFTQVLYECASAPRNESCEDRLSKISMASQRSFNSVARNVFFPAKAFEAFCEAACRRRHVWLQYPDFSRNICSFQ